MGELFEGGHSPWHFSEGTSPFTPPNNFFCPTKNPKLQENSAFLKKAPSPPPKQNLPHNSTFRPITKPLQTPHLLCHHISLFLFHAGRPVASKRHAIQPGSKLLRLSTPNPSTHQPKDASHHLLLAGKLSNLRS